MRLTFSIALARMAPWQKFRCLAFFKGGDTLMLYHFMFPRHAQDTRPGPTRGVTAELTLAEGPCPSCTALIDTWDGAMAHFEGLGGNLAVVARAPIEQVQRLRETGGGSTSGCCLPRITTSAATMAAMVPTASLFRS
jgi:predicted dithiol-disulfide oxidoreductase (DUF899 family)